MVLRPLSLELLRVFRMVAIIGIYIATSQRLQLETDRTHDFATTAFNRCLSRSVAVPVSLDVMAIASTLVAFSSCETSVCPTSG